MKEEKLREEEKVKERFYDAMDMFIESERSRAFHENELFKRETLEDFFGYLEKRKGPGFDMKDITVPDGERYFKRLRSGGKKEAYVKGRMKVLVRFMELSALLGFLDEDPWKGAFPEAE